MPKKIPVIVWFLISAYFIGYTIDLSPWKLKKVIAQDVNYYYGYLPATFIYHDLTFSYYDNPGFKDLVWSLPLPNGKRIQKMTMGTAMLYSPFFGIAHYYTKHIGGVANGYSINYEIALIWAGVFYFILGLYFLCKVLVKFMPDAAVALVLITLSFGTNLLNYAVMEGALSHVYSFFVFAFSLWIFLKWLDNPTVWITIVLGLSLGLLVLIRPSNVTFLLFLGLYLCVKENDLKRSFRLIIHLKWKLLLLAGAAFLVWMPQIAYWKFISGHYFVYSYLGERFYFLKPRIFDGLFSYHKGWLLYTPVMWLAFAGFFFMRGTLAKWLWPALITITISIYVIFSWWCWWYGGSFSARALVEFYVVMSFPLGAFFTFILQKNRIYKLVTTLLLAFCIWLNMFQTRQYQKALLHWDSMSKEAYWAIWGKESWPKNYENLLIHLDAEKAQKGESAYP
jgi:hypothetical protein